MRQEIKFTIAPPPLVGDAPRMLSELRAMAKDPGVAKMAHELAIWYAQRLEGKPAQEELLSKLKEEFKLTSAEEASNGSELG